MDSQRKKHLVLVIYLTVFLIFVYSVLGMALFYWGGIYIVKGSVSLQILIAALVIYSLAEGLPIIHRNLKLALNRKGG